MCGDILFNRVRLMISSCLGRRVHGSTNTGLHREEWKSEHIHTASKLQWTECQFVNSITLEGHEDWVRCLDLTSCPSEFSSGYDLLLASGSQDNYIRLWRIAAGVEQKALVEEKKDDGLDMLDEFERKLAGEAGGNVQISTKAHVLTVQDGNK